MKHDARVNLKINEPVGGKGVSREIAEAMKEDNVSVATPKTLDEAIDDLKI